MTVSTRQPKNSEIPDLHHIWKTVFGDSDQDIDEFFKIYFDPKMTVVADTGAGPAASGYIFPVGNICVEGVCVPCAMIYAVATLSEYRSHGLGKAVVNELISIGHAVGFSAVVLHPSEDSLFEYYSARTPLLDWFYVNELMISKRILFSEKKAELTQVTPTEYILLRKNLLSGIPHIELDLRALLYQDLLCRKYGGGLYQAKTSNGSACAIVEKQSDGVVSIKELLTSRINETEVLSAVAAEYPASGYLVRSPSPLSSSPPGKRRFGMLTLDSRIIEKDHPVFSTKQFNSSRTNAPYYGPAFD